ncbi:protein ASPARTIC PROTEASE IN GUARD CELL 2-like [Curcuma longa]|uniref:protein ASPARTIC PROTEASE IN GUARD CELL 2-like n=1 Tax=Curcuma longa TaxID=136217 RepID=UPI003D9EC206
MSLFITYQIHLFLYIIISATTCHLITEGHVFFPVSCDDSLCLSIEHRCVYREEYGDGTYTAGILTRDEFTFPARDGAFWASDATDPDFFDGVPSVTGLLSIGGGSTSLVMQLGESVRHRFSHCLIPLNRDGHSHLRFGDDVNFAGAGAETTPIDRDPDYPTTYRYVRLVGLSVQDRRLPVPAEAKW